MATEDAEAALLLRVVKGLPDHEQLILMSWLMRPATERSRFAFGLSPNPGLSFPVTQPQLTGREIQVLEKIADGADVAAIAEDMSIGEATVRNHLRNVAEKLSLPSRTASRVELTMLPIRLPRETYDQLKLWASEHGFPMSVIVRGLVERFLDQQSAA